jgi:hypothetical protein
MSTIELMIAVSVASLIFVVLGSTMLLVARGMVVVNTQARRQAEAGMALDRITEILRNAEYNDLAVSGDGLEIQFVDARTPANTSRIWVEDVTVDGEVQERLIRYRPDISDTSETYELASLLASVEFTDLGDTVANGGALVGIGVAYTYQNFRDLFPEESRNAIFECSVFLRNTVE